MPTPSERKSRRYALVVATISLAVALSANAIAFSVNRNRINDNHQLGFELCVRNNDSNKRLVHYFDFLKKITENSNILTQKEKDTRIEFYEQSKKFFKP